MKRWYKYLIMLAAAVIMLSSCSLAPSSSITTTATPAAVSAEIRLVDGLERTVVLSGPAQRIISLSPANTEVLYAIGAGSAVVARDDFSNYPAEAAALPSVGGDSGKLNMESITVIKPDLVLVNEITPPEQIKALEDLNVTVFLLKNPENFEELFASLETAGKLTGKNDEASLLVSSLKQRHDEVVQKVSISSFRPVVFYELDATDPSKPWTTGPGTFIDLLIKTGGGENIAGDLTGSWVQISQEELIIRNPDVILLGDSAYGVTVEQVAARPGWGEMKAIVENQVFPVNDDLFSRPGPRLIDGLESIAKILHPDLFK